MRALAWFLGVLMVLWIAVFIWSKVDPKNDAAACLAYFWQPCAVTADQVAANTTPAVIVSTQDTTSPVPSDLPSKYNVWIQFAGYERPTIIELAAILTRNGWKVQGADRGGERIQSAAGLAEVRYGNGDKQAAEALAAAVSATKVKTVKTVQNDDIKSQTLEVWIGQ